MASMPHDAFEMMFSAKIVDNSIADFLTAFIENSLLSIAKVKSDSGYKTMLLSKAIPLVKMTILGYKETVEVHTSGGEDSDWKEIAVEECKVPASYLGITSSKEDMTPIECVIVSYADGKKKEIKTAEEFRSILKDMLSRGDKPIYTMINGIILPFDVFMCYDEDSGNPPDLLILSHND